MTSSHTPQTPAVDDLVARLRKALAEYDQAVEWHSYRRHDVDREAEQHKAAARLAEIVREALTSQQHAEPVAGEVEVTWVPRPSLDEQQEPVGEVEVRVIAYNQAGNLLWATHPDIMPYAEGLVYLSDHQRVVAERDREIAQLGDIIDGTKAHMDAFFARAEAAEARISTLEAQLRQREGSR